ncbi:CBS domain-containing protein [Corynebacterium faecium]|uniref:CBS domain-containing protein n=1 Tax=Corynebacterium faecium TaxID=3016001 RepID=UPI0022B5D7BA
MHENGSKTLFASGLHNTDRFINHVEEIQRLLADRYGIKFRNFGEALKYAEEQRHPVVSKHSSDFDVLRETRNIIQHSPRNSGQAVVVPSDWVLNTAQKLLNKMANPVRVKEVMVQPEHCFTSDEIHRVLKTIVEKNYSQLPVFENGRYISLLTTNGIARWVADAADTSGDILLGVAEVQEVLGSVESGENPRFVRPTDSIARLLELFTSPEYQSDCVLVSDTGHQSGNLLGLVTKFDLPRIYAML